jgi:hypothetical protein
VAHSCTNASICYTNISLMHKQGKYVRRVQDLMLCQLEMDFTIKTVTRLLLVPMGNYMAWSSCWFWLDVQVLIRCSVSSNSLMLSLVSILVFMVNVMTTFPHLSWFPSGRAHGGLPPFDMDIEGCQLFWFHLIWTSNWKPKDICFFFACDLI